MMVPWGDKKPPARQETMSRVDTRKDSEVNQEKALVWMDDIDKTDIMLHYLEAQCRSNGWLKNDPLLPQVMLFNESTAMMDCIPPRPKQIIRQADLLDGAKVVRAKVAMIMSSSIVTRLCHALPQSLQSWQVTPIFTLNIFESMPYEHRKSYSSDDFKGAFLIRDIEGILIWSMDVEHFLDWIRYVERLLALASHDDEEMERQAFVYHRERDGIANNEEKLLPGSEDSTSIASINTEDLEFALANPRAGGSYVYPVIIVFVIALQAYFLGDRVRKLVFQVITDGNLWYLFGIFFLILTMIISLFFCMYLAVGIVQIFGPIHQLKQNSKSFSAQPPNALFRPNFLPRITIQCPVFKENLRRVMVPTLKTCVEAVRAYEKAGGQANIYVNDDGLPLLSEKEALERKRFYAKHNIAWVSRPADGQHSYVRSGLFKKASNLNFGLEIAMKVEEILSQHEDRKGWAAEDEWEHYKATFGKVLNEIPGSEGAGDIRIGEIILVIDSDTRVPPKSLLHASCEFTENPSLGFLQFSGGAVKVTNDYWENALAAFLGSTYRAIEYVCAGGDTAPLLGHNVFLRWNAMRDVAITDKTGKTQWWSNAHVSEDLELAIRLWNAGYISRLATYLKNEFKEGVSLTVYDEILRWEKYSFGMGEIVLNHIWEWPYKTPFTHTFWSVVQGPLPIYSKFGLLIYMSSYYGIGFAWLFYLANYFLYGWSEEVIEILSPRSLLVLVSVLVAFPVKDIVTTPILAVRTARASLRHSFQEAFIGGVLMTIMFSGISMHMSRALIYQMLGLNLSWEATMKTSEGRSLLEELPRIARRFQLMYCTVLGLVAMMICLSYAVPVEWQIHKLVATFPLAYLICAHAVVPVLLNPQSYLSEIQWGLSRLFGASGPAN